MSQSTFFEQLVDNLERVVKVYRSLLLVVRQEKDILISANLDDLNENNKTKESVLMQSRSLEKERLEILKNLIEQEKIENKNVSLLELANHLQGVQGEKLRNLNAVLELLIKRVRDINSQNETLIQSALKNITGAMKSIKEMLDENKTYKKKGTISDSQNHQSSGRLVSKQV
ncbi:MAG: flagellar protein FlgN [Bdellovibrionaceae bacterium]|nr:flagellar protein FlgN [Pseudobdellovibrionaceae bacterium]